MLISTLSSKHYLDNFPRDDTYYKHVYVTSLQAFHRLSVFNNVKVTSACLSYH